jgi:hypothetical protein
MKYPILFLFAGLLVRADHVTQTFTHPLDPGRISETVDFIPFDSTLGTLTAQTLTVRLTSEVTEALGPVVSARSGVAGVIETMDVDGVTVEEVDNLRNYSLRTGREKSWVKTETRTVTFSTPETSFVLQSETDPYTTGWIGDASPFSLELRRGVVLTLHFDYTPSEHDRHPH